MYMFILCLVAPRIRGGSFSNGHIIARESIVYAFIHLVHLQEAVERKVSSRVYKELEIII